MKKIYLLSVAALLTMLCGCNGINTLKGNGQVTTKTVATETFKNLKISCQCDVELIHSDTTQVIITADENLQPYFLVEQHNGELLVHNTDKISFLKSNHCKVVIQMASIDKLEISGVGNISCGNQLTADTLDLNVSGVGNIHLNLLVSKLMMRNKSVGNLQITGSGNIADVNNSSVGDMNMKDFHTKQMTIHNSSVGNASVYASEEITIEHSGIGNFSYSGDAAVKGLSASSIGKVSKE